MEIMDISKEEAMEWLESNKKKVIYVTALLGVIIAAFVINANISEGVGRYYEVRKDKVPAIGKAIGQMRKISSKNSYKDGNTEVKEFSYEKAKSINADIISYIKELQLSEGFTLIKGYDMSLKDQEVKLAKQSETEKNRVLTVDIICRGDYESTEGTYKIIIKSLVGTIAK